MNLWEADHSYYCNEGNYFSRECVNRYDAWRDFVNEEGDSDEDYNLVFRWDWLPPNEDRDYHQLQVCWVAQRKGYYRTTFVRVTEDDEPEVRAWLLARFHHLTSLWAPIVPGDIPEGATYATLASAVKDAGNVVTMTDGTGAERRFRVSGEDLPDQPTETPPWRKGEP